MNIGHMIFQRMQRLQEGAANVSMKFARSEHPPRQMSTWADYFEMLLNERDMQEKERLELESGLPAEKADPSLARKPPDKQPSGEGQRFQGGVSTVSDEEYEQALNDDFERNLRKRRFKPKKGKQFDPRDVPVFYDIDSGQKIFDPKYSSSEDAMYAQGGEYDVRGKEPPFTEGGKWWWERADEQAKLDDEQGHDSTEGPAVIPPGLNYKGEKMSPLEEARESTFSTIGLKGLDNRDPEREWEVPTTWEEMPPAVMEYVHNLPQDQWPPWVLDAIENNARDLLEQGIHPLTGYKVDDPRNTPDPTPTPQYAQGTNNVGLRLFMAGQGIHKPKQRKKKTQ